MGMARCAWLAIKPKQSSPTSSEPTALATVKIHAACNMLVVDTTPGSTMTPLPKPPPIPFSSSPSQQVVVYFVMGRTI